VSEWRTIVPKLGSWIGWLPVPGENEMTYRELLENLKNLSENQLDMDVSVRDVQTDEYFSGSSFVITDETDVLDENHPVIHFV